MASADREPLSFDDFRLAQYREKGISFSYTGKDPSDAVSKFLACLAPDGVCDLVDKQTQSLLKLSALMVAPPDQRLSMDQVCTKIQELFPEAKNINSEVQEKIQKFMTKIRFA